MIPALVIVLVLLAFRALCKGVMSSDRFADIVDDDHDAHVDRVMRTYGCVPVSEETPQ